MEKVSKLPLHTLARPLIAPGVAGMVLTVTANVCAVELPHVLLAVTETVPLEPVVPMIVSVLEVPVQPPGSDHV